MSSVIEGNAAHLELADRYLPGASLGMFQLPHESRFVIARGKGSRVWDSDGKEYIDFVMGSGPMVLGHAPDSVVEAVQNQVALGSTFYGLNEPVVRLAHEICEASPCGEMARFTCSGTDATFSAIRLARAYTGKERVLKFDGGWHGGHDYAQQDMADDGQTSRPLSDGIPKGATDTVLVSPFNDAAAATDLIGRYATELAAVIVEPLQRAIKPEPGFLEALREVTDKHGIVLIFDEVVTGFRLAWGGAQEHYGVTGDVAVYGKTISGGYPLAAVCGKKEVIDCADPGRKGKGPYVFISGTFNGNPISATAGLATIDALHQPGVYERLFEVTDRLATGFDKAAAERGIPFQIIGDGPVLQPFFFTDPIRNHADSQRGDRTRITQFGDSMIEQGIFINPSGKIYLSLAHTDEDIDRAIDAAGNAFDQMN